MVSGQVYDTTVVDDDHTLNIVISLRKDGRRKEMLRDGLLLRFRDPTSVYTKL